MIDLRAGDRIKARNRAIIAANLPHFDAFFARHADRFDWEHRQGGSASAASACTAPPAPDGSAGTGLRLVARFALQTS